MCVPGHAHSPCSSMSLHPCGRHRATDWLAPIPMPMPTSTHPGPPLGRRPVSRWPDLHGCVGDAQVQSSPVGVPGTTDSQGNRIGDTSHGYLPAASPLRLLDGAPTQLASAGGAVSLQSAWRSLGPRPGAGTWKLVWSGAGAPAQVRFLRCPGGDSGAVRWAVASCLPAWVLHGGRQPQPQLPSSPARAARQQLETPQHQEPPCWLP